MIIFNKLLHNWSLKVLALAIALTMWIFVAGQEKNEISVRIPIELTNIPPEYIIIDEIIGEVDVRLYGPRSLIRLVVTKKLSKIVNLNGLGIGTHIFQINIEDLKLPPGIRVLRINPDVIRLTLVPCLTREIAIQPIIKGKPSLGYELTEIDLNPSKVVVIGSKEEVVKLDYVFTLPIDVNDHHEAYYQTIQLRLPRERNVRLNQNEITATLNIRPHLISSGIKTDSKYEVIKNILNEKNNDSASMYIKK